MQIHDLSDIWSPNRPNACDAYSGRDLSGEPLYTYSPVGSRQIRLLHVQPGTGFTNIECTLSEVDLTKDLAYEAVSYCWGSSEKPCNILCNGRRMPVTESAVDALWRFRLPTAVRTVWLDAVCIDQANTSEKGEQVVMMAEIYGSARQVLAWVGHAAVGSDTLFGKLQRVLRAVHKDVLRRLYDEEDEATKWLLYGDIYSLDHIHTFLHQEGYIKQDQSFKQRPLFRQLVRIMTQMDWLAIAKLCARSYFERAWIVQELVLAKSTVMFVGQHTMDFDSFATVVSILCATAESAGFGSIVRNAAQGIVFALNSRLDRGTQPRGLATMALAAQQIQLKSTLPTDKLFALRSLAIDGDGIRVDYASEAYEVYLHAGQSLMNSPFPLARAASLRPMLLACRLTPAHERGLLPSWIPDMTSATTADDPRDLARFIAGGLYGEYAHILGKAVLSPNNPKRLVMIGKAVGSVAQLCDPSTSFLVPRVQFWKRDGSFYGDNPGTTVAYQTGLTLKALGRAYQVADWEKEVEGVYSVWIRSLLAERIQHLKQWTTFASAESLVALKQTIKSSSIFRRTISRYKTNASVQETLMWRAICMDSERDFNPSTEFELLGIPPLTEAVCNMLAKLVHAVPDLGKAENWTGLHSALRSLSDEELATVTLRLRMITPPNLDSRFCCTTEGAFGWVPKQSRVGDTVCVVPAMPCPLILRRVLPPEQTAFQLVGPAYIGRLMYGEVVRKAVAEEQVFEIC
ncbi:hypothetical protein LTR56_026549 [Elasticomyces elasticus]|nr:hypothetical protein LTR56_026549 [Elasticomyces elasticus]KAK3634544.1 hypothetical protein LTR22_019574 [Elasticomyces elasticus]KAK4917097.1 hypothetical protein LTR49_015000 [Elasticomyces elasticus]KAK5743756.1 hypothetical protein LTS12_023705 [Elasticomyces elasticus]